MSDLKFTSIPISKLFGEPEVEIICNSREIRECLSTVIKVLENIRLLDYFDAEKYSELRNDEFVTEAKILRFLDELEQRYPIRITYEDIDP